MLDRTVESIPITYTISYHSDSVSQVQYWSPWPAGTFKTSKPFPNLQEKAACS